MAVIMGMFYWVFVRRLEGETALWRAVDELLIFLENTGRENVLIEIANEIDVVLDRTQSVAWFCLIPGPLTLGEALLHQSLSYGGGALNASGHPWA